jgi:hypothetical protein
MSFREKIAWVSLASIALVYGVYFFGSTPGFEVSSWRLFGCIFALVVMEVALIITVAAVTAVRARQDVDAPLDERERLIALQGKAAGFTVLTLGGIGAIAAAMLLDATVGQLANGVLLALVLGDLARYGVQVWRYRQGT